MDSEYRITPELAERFRGHLVREERSAATIGKYLRDLAALTRFLGGTPVTKEGVVAWKENLVGRGYAVASINSMLVAVNSFFGFCQWQEFRVKLLRTQRRCFRDRDRELTKEEYRRLVQTARSRGDERLCLLLQAICSTGIRVSEHRFLTVEALRSGRAVIASKGKRRTIFMPPELCGALLRYCGRRGVASGPVFTTRTGRPMDRSQIWAKMKTLCQSARVDPHKVFPHNLRHLFAVTFYRLDKDIVRLADVLGHASIETSRIYTCTTGTEHIRALSRLQLLV